ncbi:MAG: NAD(P)H-dependent oxidoreductase subunit E, partial [Deltaproteobacteria bacterium]|nr:NAD(P)H-dependent oxidoreductase subunit E [Deltaproteobacteria bacterium]
CLGCCSLAPVATVNDEVHGRLNRARALELARDLEDS